MSRHHPCKSVAPLCVLLAAVVIGGLLRFISLDASPPGLFRDELEKGYTALQLWETGRHGILGAEGVRVSRWFPLFIETFEGHDRTSAIYQYSAAPIVGIFGLNYWTTRIPAAIAGTLAIILVGGFLWRLSGPWVGAAAAVLLSIHPTGILFSRWAQQGVIQMMLVPAGFWLLLESELSAEKHRRALSAVGGILLGAAAWAYDPGRLVIPLMAAAWYAWRLMLLPTSERAPWVKASLPGMVILVVLSTSLIVYTLGTGRSRLERVALDGGVIAFATNYLSFGNPLFWFQNGDANPRHHLPGTGFAGPLSTLILIGALARLALLLVKRRRSALADPACLLVVWLLLSPMAAALTNEGNPHALRALLLVPTSALLGATLVGSFQRDRFRLWVPAVLLGVLIGGAVSGGLGLRQLASGPGAPWEAGTVEAVRYGLSKPGVTWLSAEVPYAAYVALFAEQTDPALFQELGLGALQTRLVFPGQSPTLHPGDTWITPPRPGLPMHYHTAPVVLYERGAQGAFARLPPGKEYLYPEQPGFPP